MTSENFSDACFEAEKFHDECAVMGIWGSAEAANLTYLGLYALQHRGQEGSGIVTSVELPATELPETGNFELRTYKNAGLVSEIFSEDVLAKLPGSVAIGHNRYATFGGKSSENLQPFVANLQEGSFAVAHNGNLINAAKLRKQLEQNGAIFTSTSDSEVFLHLIARTDHSLSFAQRICAALPITEGAYSLVLLHEGALYGARDPYGVRPLVLGKLSTGYCLASESCAFDLIGATYVREVLPGEVIEISTVGTIRSYRPAWKEENQVASCVFELVYFSRPDSEVGSESNRFESANSESVYTVRKRMGAELAREHPAEADLVIPIPDSGVPAAIGYAQEIGIPMEFGLVRNHYVGRTFIEPKQSIRDFGVKVKLNPIRRIIEGKKLVVVDDSVVRGTTCKKIIKILREAGAKEIHLRVSSPPTIGSCHYGVDTPSEEELIANKMTHQEITKYIGADSLGYLSLPGMYNAVQGSREKFCDACFSGEYRLGRMEKKNEHSSGLVPLRRGK
jgi:amidophosphoribosyltransferase